MHNLVFESRAYGAGAQHRVRIEEMKMELHIAGINHFDPLCRARLICWLERLLHTKKTSPAFIAIEASNDAYKKILDQREIFRQMLKSEFPNVSPVITDLLVQSLYYEADTYQIIFPDVNIIWLDANRELDQSTLDNYARDRLNIYRRFMNKDNSLRMIGEAYWNDDWKLPPTTPLGDPDYHRDYVIFNMINNAIATHNGSWAIVIVGASHASNREHSAKILLEKAGILCLVKILDDNYSNSMG